MVQWLALSPHSKKVLRLNPGQDVSLRSLQVLSQQTCHIGFRLIRLIVHSKLTVGVNVSVDGCLSLYVSPAMNWLLVQDVPRLHPNMLRLAPAPHDA